MRLKANKFRNYIEMDNKDFENEDYCRSDDEDEGTREGYIDFKTMVASVYVEIGESSCSDGDVNDGGDDDGYNDSLDFDGNDGNNDVLGVDGIGDDGNDVLDVEGDDGNNDVLGVDGIGDDGNDVLDVVGDGDIHDVDGKGNDGNEDFCDDDGKVVVVGMIGGNGIVVNESRRVAKNRRLGSMKGNLKDGGRGRWRGIVRGNSRSRPEWGGDDDSVDDDVFLQDLVGDDNRDEIISTTAPKKKKMTSSSKWVFETPVKILRKRGREDIVREQAGPTGPAKGAKSEYDAFKLFMTDEMVNEIVHRTNMQMVKNRERSNRSDSSTRNTDERELRCLFGLILFRGLFSDIQQPCQDLWYSTLASRPIYRATMSLKRYERLTRNISFHDPVKLREMYQNDRFARMRWFVDSFEKNARTHYRHTEFLCIDKTLRNYYGTYHCDFKMYMPDKPGKYGLLFRCMADAKDRYVSRVIPHVTPPINDPERKTEVIHDLVMEMCSDILGTGRNVTGGGLYSSIETAEALYANNVTYVGTKLSNRVCQ